MPARKYNKHWSQREKDELAMLWKSMTSNEIATLMDRTTIAVRRQAHRMGLDCGTRWGHEAAIWTVAEEKKLRAMWEQGVIVTAICERLNRTRQAVAMARYRLGLASRHRRFTEAEQSRLRAMAVSGATVRQIADEFERPTNVVRAWLVRNRIRPARDGNKGPWGKQWEKRVAG